ncbi:hypothetical protein FOB72_12910 [Cupriavidus pauculus]|uniref:Abi family protein n=1 Tax=Cupriavidus pauculus TaxID=82633 RepID=A0A5P2H4M5_9BURK|nr:hypothetical protein [Cupriavidus pauculus]QET02856.1 hypothetical protein FOB72_12910 [Cupriavidus pauculus]
MSMALQSLMLTFEVALRNRVHVSLSRQATEKSGCASDSFPWYDYCLGLRKLQGATFDRIEALLCDDRMIRLKLQPSPDSVIAKLTFGVWPNILEQQLPTPVVQARTFLDVFANYPKNPRKHWNHPDNRKAAITVLKDVNAWRNRIAHCEPVWTQGWYRNSTTQHWTEVLDRVRRRRAEMLTVLGWMCPQTLEVYQHSYNGRLFEMLLTEHAVLAHIVQPYVPGAGPVYPQMDEAGMSAYKARR